MVACKYILFIFPFTVISLPLVIASAYLAYLTVLKVQWGFSKLTSHCFFACYINSLLLVLVRFDFISLLFLPGQNKITEQLQVDNFINMTGCTDLEFSKTFGSCDPDYPAMQTEPWIK